MESEKIVDHEGQNIVEAQQNTSISQLFYLSSCFPIPTLIRIPIVFLIVFLLCRPVYALEPWVGIFFSPQANTKNSHDIFLSDFEALVKSLKEKGFNTIVFDMDGCAYHFNTDVRMKNLYYSANKGFTPTEAHRMAEIVRANGMHVIVAMQILTHSVGDIFSYVYPEYMLPGMPWQKGVSYTKNIDCVQYNNKTYRCISTHISNNRSAPPSASYWLASPSYTRDPFNKDGEAVVFKMIDELIDTFTVNNVKPDGFHICSDELITWYNNPLKETGKTSAEIYALAITNTYNHIKAKNPFMEVIMWGDMLDPYWNGSPANKNTSGAINLLPKDMIIADWRYESTHYYRYDSVKKTFPSIREFINKGFRVWPTSCCDVNATTDLIWTGNMEQARTGKVMGHLYSTWLSGIVPELKLLLAEPDYEVPDAILTSISQDDQPKFRQQYRGTADSINATINLIGLKQCRGTDFNCGAYPDCEDCSEKDGYYGSDFRGYYCKSNQIAYNIIHFPSDYGGYWKFNRDASDSSGRNPGKLMNDIAIGNDPVRGRVAHFSGTNAYVKIKDSYLLHMGTGSISVSAWFKAGASEEFGTITSKNPNLTNYSLLLSKDGRILFETNGNNFYRYSADGINHRDNKWHNVVAIFDSSVPTIDIYMDGILSNGASMFIDGSNVKSSITDLLIGNINGNGLFQFKGLLGAVMIYNRALSRAEAKMIFFTQRKQDFNIK